jgi:hypothetical protein
MGELTCPPIDDLFILDEVSRLQVYPSIDVRTHLYTNFSPFLSATFSVLGYYLPQHEESIVRRQPTVPSSALMIGRSGTGKTSIVMQRMLHIERQGREKEAKLLPPRQLFLTVSKKLTTTTASKFRGINAVDSISLAVTDAPELPHRLSDLQQEHFPLFLTLDQFLKMLVSRVPVWLVQPVLY